MSMVYMQKEQEYDKGKIGITVLGLVFVAIAVFAAGTLFGHFVWSTPDPAQSSQDWFSDDEFTIEVEEVPPVYTSIPPPNQPIPPLSPVIAPTNAIGYNQMTDAYLASQQAAKDQAALVERLRANPTHDPRSVAVPERQWVNPLTAGFADPYYSCAIDVGGTLREIGSEGGKVLVVYAPPPTNSPFPATSCEGEEIFFLNE
jgi:hypothetical protein